MTLHPQRESIYLGCPSKAKQTALPSAACLSSDHSCKRLLTQNSMQGHVSRQVLEYFRRPQSQQQSLIEYEGTSLHQNGPLNRHSPVAGPVSSDQVDELLLGHHLVDFWTNICVCHNLITEEGEAGGLPVYQVLFHAWPVQPWNSREIGLKAWK